MALIEPGQPAPPFALPDQDGSEHSLSAYAGQPFVLYFYPKDDTSGCTKQACGFQDALPDFDGAHVRVLGVSPDDVASHRRFASKYDLSFPLLADVPGDDDVPAVCQAYGVWQEKSMYGRTYMGVVRTTYLIDAGGTVVRRWDKVKVNGHAEDVLNAVTALAS